MTRRGRRDTDLRNLRFVFPEQPTLRRHPHPFAAMWEAAVPSRIQQVSLLVLAAALVTAGVAGGQWFMESGYVVFGYLVSGTRDPWRSE